MALTEKSGPFFDVYEYSYLLSNLERNWVISEAIDKAVKTCIENGILVEYLTEHRADVQKAV